jgi:hypothetical protein
MKEKILILNLVSVFVTGFALTAILHEMAHFFVAKMLDVEPILFHSFVSYDSSGIAPVYQTYIAAAGPLFSFFQFLLFIWMLRKRINIDFVAFFYLWMGIIGMIVFFGYIMMGPFVPYGDTGKVYAFLSIPKYVSLSLTVVALICIIYIFKKLTPVLGNFIFQIKNETDYSNKKCIFLFFVFPLLLGTIINVILSLPAPTPMSLVLPFVVSLTMVPSAIRLKGLILASAKNSLSNNVFLKNIYWPIISMIFMIVVSRILSMGIRI